MKFLLIQICFIVIPFSAFSQDGLGYYRDNNNNFSVFYKGKSYVLERTSVDSINIGDDYIAYMDAIADLKVFYNGESKIIESAFPQYIVARSNMLIYKMEQRLMIYEHGVKKELTNWAGDIMTHEEIVVWQNLPSRDLMAYVNGEVYTIEKAVEFNTIKEYQIGRNIFIYNDLNNHLKIFWNGIVYDSHTSNITEFKCGKNTAAYYDPFYNEFKVFYNGVFSTVCSFNPKEYQVGDNMVAYIDINEYFKVFYKGSDIRLLNYRPSSYSIKNSILQYYDFGEMKNKNNNRMFYVFYDGKTHLLEKFIPKKDALTGFHSLLYFDNNGRVKYFYKGTIHENFLFEKPRIVELYRDLAHYKYANYSEAFFYDGKLYEFSGIKNVNQH